MQKPTILVIEDDRDITELIRYNLEREGFRVLASADGERGLEATVRSKPDLVLLDLMLPGMDGLEVCRRIREGRDSRSIPVIMLTAKGDEADVVVGLEMGADDYLAKPFSPRELVARIRTVLRRASRGRPEIGRTRVEIDDLVVDRTRHEVLLKGEPVTLTRAEFRLLWALAQHPGRVFARDDLIDEITAGENLIVGRNVDVHVSSIRKKLGDAGKMIATVRGVGYKCVD